MKTKLKLVRAYLLLKTKPDQNSQVLLDVLKSRPYKVLHTYRNLILIESTEDELSQLKEQWQNSTNEDHDWHVILSQYVASIVPQAKDQA
jgi:hypothetical protein